MLVLLVPVLVAVLCPAAAAVWLGLLWYPPFWEEVHAGRAIPLTILLLLAGLESLPQDPYEAAKIDGATWWQELRYITLPLMAPAIAVTFAFRLVIAFKVFDEVYLLTAGGPVTATQVLSFTLYQRFFTEDRAGYGSAMAVAIIFLCSLLFIVALSVRRRSERAA